MSLPTKIQYKNFEPGEFLDKKERTYEETIGLIESFPWEDQRDHLHVDLTAPSITIKDKEGNYLKLALYYEGKFVLYYLDADNHLFTKSFAHYQDAYPYLNAFYATSPFDTGDFKKQINWFRGKSIHFRDRTFEYRLNEQKFWFQFILLAGMLLTMMVAWTGKLLTLPAIPVSGIIISLLFLIVMALFGINMAVLHNNYQAGRKKVLIMSKGDPVFYYGEAGNPEKFIKTDIRTITSYHVNNRRNWIVGYLSVEIGARPGRIINIPNMVIDELSLTNKLSGYPLIQKNKWFPFIPSSSSAPF